MHQCVMIGPTTDAVEPGLEEFELAVAELAVEFLQQEHGGYLFFQHRAREKLIGDLDQEIESVFFSHLAAKTYSGAAQVRRIPAVRFDFIFEEPLHAGSVLCGAAVVQDAAKLSGDSGGCGPELRQGLTSSNFLSKKRRPAEAASVFTLVICFTRRER